MDKVLIEKDVAEAIEDYKKGIGSRTTSANMKLLCKIMNKIDAFTLAFALTEGYEIVDKMTMNFEDEM
ncbi:hypothetical protein [Psychrobacillus phage Perkons]|nr:hypothetical protein [Psychrobacillus phage Perkons]